MNVRKTTLKDVALHTGYTINTVSRALKDKTDISEATRNVIKQAAKEMGYIANSLAGSLRSGTTKTIAIILGDISNPHFGIMVKEIEKEASKHNYTLIIINTEEDDSLEEQAIISAIGKNVDGIILCPTQKRLDNIRFLQKTGIPFVLLGRYFPDEPEVDFVVCDDVQGGYLAAKHLLEQGHTQILFLNGPPYISSAKERQEGFLKAYQEAGLTPDPLLIQEIAVTSGSAQQVVKDLLKDGAVFTGVVGFSDMIAWEVAYVLGRQGQNAESVAIVGFDNIQSRMFFPFPLTSISNSKTKMSKRSFNILLRKINHPQASQRHQEKLEVQLVKRESTAVRVK